VIRNLYDTFFKEAFPRMAERLGIVYTPVEVVDFIIQSVEVALQKHFKASLNDKGVQVIDPFTGTGTFITRLLQSGLITPEALHHKYANELHANELVLLAYYIASINIESTYHAQTGSYAPFNGIVLTDTFQISEDGDMVDKVVLPENNERITHQLKQDIRVIIGNPPYSAQQDSENDNNQNIDYPTLDARIRSTYAEQSNAKLLKNLYDSYIRAIRWASDRIKDHGIVAFVTNGSFMDANNMDGLRKCLATEFSHIYVFNLKGFIRGKSKDLSKIEGGNIFDILTGVAITIMIKDKNHEGRNELNYYDIGDCLSKDEKLHIIDDFSNMASIAWQPLTPNSNGDWINKRDPVFDTFVQMGAKDNISSDVIFSSYSLGVVTNRDPWTYSFSLPSLESNMRKMIDSFNGDSKRYAVACKGKRKDQWPDIEAVIDSDPTKISWTRSLKADAKRSKNYEFSCEYIVEGTYRPFVKQWMYFNRRFNEMVYQVPKLFPTSKHKNIVISSTGVADRKGYTAFIANKVPNLHLTDTGQCFPLYWYEKVETEGGEAQQPAQTAMFATEKPQDMPDEHGYVRREAITDWALQAFQEHYGDSNITKENLFFYVYGILHSPEYKSRFASDLKKMLPRIPYAADFWAFSNAGRQLAMLHMNYETVEPFPLAEEKKRMIMEAADYRVQRMVFGKAGGKPDKSVIVYNAHLTLRNIPLEAYGYVVNGKSAIEWVMERYAVTKDKESGITNDANQWSDDPRYIVDLIKRVVTVSVESVKVVAGLPSLGI
jgi:predicted helicase